MNIIRRIILAIIVLILIGGASLFAFAYYTRADSPQNILAFLLSQVPQQASSEESPATRELPEPTFLSASDLDFDASLEINLPTLFTAPVIFEQAILAPNVVYELTAGDGIELSGDPQSPTIRNTGLLSLEGLNGDVELLSDNIKISTSGNTITFSADIPSLPDLPEFPAGEIVGTTDTQLLTNKSVRDLTFVPSVTPQIDPGKVYYDSADETLYVYTDTYGWRDLTAGGITYTADGEGIELSSNQFQLELDGDTLSKSAAGLRISALYPGQESIATVGTITSGSWNASEILDSYITDSLTISSDGTVDDGALSINVSLLGQSVDTFEVENESLRPEDMNSGGTAPSNGYVLTYNGDNSLFRWQSPSTVFGSNWSRDDVNGILYPTTADDIVLISSNTKTPLTLTNTSSSISMLVNDEHNDTTPFVIDSTGDVGIGTTNPVFKLQVEGKVGVNGIQSIYIPEQSIYSGTMILGNGGTYLTASSGGDGQNNLFVGLNAGFSATTGYSNTILGQLSGFQLATGSENIMIGRAAGSTTTSGSRNVFIGTDVAGQNNVGSSNIMIGYRTGYFNSSGSMNVLVGEEAGAGTGVHPKIGNVMLGYRAGYNETGSNKLYIDNTSTSQPLIWGDFFNDTLAVNGLMGVGTTSPQARLDISSSSNQLIIRSNISSFVNMNVNSSGELGISPSGTNIGLGTTDPSYRLDVVGTGRFNGNLRLSGAFYDAAGGPGSVGEVLTSTGVGTTWRSLSTLLDPTYFKMNGNSFGSNAYIGTADSYSLSIITDGIPKLYIDPTGDIGIGGTLPSTNPALFVGGSGRVGVGTTNPIVQFQTLGQMMINATGDADEELHIGPSLGSTETAISMENNGTVFELHVTQSGLFRITDSSKVNEYFSISSSGYVGIGTTDPGSQLAINGLGSSSGTALVIDASGNVWKDSSSRRYKTNIGSLQTDFRKILNLQPVSYDFKGTGVRTIGYIAEDLDAMGLRDLVVYDQLGQPDAIKYDRLAIYLTEVVKEQQKSISELNTKIMLELDSEGSVEVDMPDTSSLPASEFEKIDVDKEGNDEFLALKQLVNTKLVSDIENVQKSVSELDKELQTSSSKSAELAANTQFSIATLSGKLADVENQILGLSTQALTASVSAQISMQDAVFDGITATGNANFYDLGVTGDLIAGLIKIDAETTSINTFAEPLRLQSEKMADVEIMDGLVRITREGDLEVDGSVKAGKFMVDTSDTVNASAGEGELLSGQNGIIVKTESVSDGSLIYVTFTSDYSPATRYWVEGRKNGESFILRTDQPMAQDSSFSWWIVN